MTALSAERDTPRQGPNTDSIHVYPVDAAAVIYKGALVCLDAGYCKPAEAATGLIIVGRAEESVDNTDGDPGDLSVTVRSNATFKWVNDGGDAVDQTGVGTLCYALDDQTVTATPDDDGQPLELGPLATGHR